MEKEFTLKKYDSVDDILFASFAIDDPELDAEEFKNSEFGGFDEVKNDINFSYEQQKEGINSQGLWGWVDDNNVIHYWIGKKIPMEELIHFFAHEIGHRKGIPVNDDFEEEMRAESYGEAATLAYDFAKQINESN